MKFLFRIVIAVCVLSLCLAGCSSEPEQSVEELVSAAFEQLQAGNAEQAEESAQKALNQAEEQYSMLHPELVKPLHVLGMAYQQQDKFFDAEQAYGRAISILQSTGNENNIAVSQLMNNLAGVYYSQEKYKQALDTFQQSLAVAQSHYSEDDPRIQKIKKNIETCQSEVSGQAPGKELAETAGSGPGSRTGGTDKQPAEQGMTRQGIGEQGQGQSQAEADQGTDMFAYDQPEPEEPPDVLPDKIKQTVLKKLTKQNIHLDNLRPMEPVKIDSQGAVIPYRCTQKTTEADEGGIEAVLLFATVLNQETGGLVFKQCRMVSYESYEEELKSGNQTALVKALKEVFPRVYS